MSASRPLLCVEQLHFAWPGAAPLFDGLSLQAGPGLTWVCGDEGVGKTTLLALIAGALAPQAGRLEAAGTDRARDPDGYRRQVFWVDPRSTEHDAMPGAGYLEAAARHWPALDEDLLADCVDGFGLDEHLHKPLYMLSTGSRRKLWLCAALASGARDADRPALRRARHALDPLPAHVPGRRRHGRHTRLARGRPRAGRSRRARCHRVAAGPRGLNPAGPQRAPRPIWREISSFMISLVPP